MHVSGRPLVLPNAWDAASARLMVEAGAAAVATTSAGVSWAGGRADGGGLSRDEALAAIGRIAASVDVPVTADVESGYAATPDAVAAIVSGVLSAGAVGINLEDSLRPVEEQVERIAAARGAADAQGVPLFVNARIDTHRLPVDAGADWLAETVARASAYGDAGADGVFVLGDLDARRVEALVAAVSVPLNVLSGPGTLPVAALAALGVARVSSGSSIAEAAYGLVARVARELLAEGTGHLREGGLSYSALNALWSR
jgi:2-methylisocitrate lyase-like PEP mutase family enzyme